MEEVSQRREEQSPRGWTRVNEHDRDGLVLAPFVPEPNSPWAGAAEAEGEAEAMPAG